MKFTDLRIGARLFCVFFVVILLFALTTALQIQTMKKLGSLQDEVVKRSQDALFVGKIDSRLEALYGIVADAIINGDLDKTTKDLAQAKAQATADIMRMREIADTREEKIKVDELNGIYQNYFGKIETKLIPLLRTEGSKINSTIREIDSEIDVFKTSAMERLDGVLESISKESSEADANFDITSKSSINTALIGNFLSAFRILDLRQ